MSTKKTMERLKRSKEHRSAYVASQISMGVPFQIRSLRKQRKWDQQKLATEAQMLQPRISAMEKPGYGNLNLDTLKRLAAAFDVALVVRFAPFSELIRWSDRFSPDDFNALGFEEELENVESSEGNVVAFNYLATSNSINTVKVTQGTITDYVEKENTGGVPTVAESANVVTQLRRVA